MNDDEIRNDILKEIFNISIGNAASILSEIINKKILLSIPNVKIYDLQEDDFRITDFLPKNMKGTLMISSISFAQELNGNANLIFPAEKMRIFLNLCMNNEEKSEQNDMNFTDIDFDIIKEIGNIILNSVIGEVANYLEINLEYTLPEVKVYNNINLGSNIDNRYRNILLLDVEFVIDDVKIDGAVVIDLTLNSVNELNSRLDKIKDEIYG